MNLKELLSDYEKALGQLINYEKLAFSFSSNVNPNVRKDIKQIFNIKEVAFHDKYLGLPSKNKHQFFGLISDQVWSELQ